MNYKRIYDEFIANRRFREPYHKGRYLERHHIVPRSLGGGDNSENIIKLVPEDHFFAHLCLAKIHGGTQWAPIAFMVGGQRKDYRPIISRRRYAWTIREMARARRGKGAHQFDWTIYELEHQDGRTWTGKQSEIPKGLGLSPSLANTMLKGKIRSARGWYIKGNRPKYFGRGNGGKDHKMYRQEIITFLHLDGRKFVGTQNELHQKFGVSKAAACVLARGKNLSALGWYVAGRPPSKRGRAARWFKDAQATSVDTSTGLIC